MVLLDWVARPPVAPAGRSAVFGDLGVAGTFATANGELTYTERTIDGDPVATVVLAATQGWILDVWSVGYSLGVAVLYVDPDAIFVTFALRYLRVDRDGAVLAAAAVGSLSYDPRWLCRVADGADGPGQVLTWGNSLQQAVFRTRLSTAETFGAVEQILSALPGERIRPLVAEAVGNGHAQVFQREFYADGSWQRRSPQVQVYAADGSALEAGTVFKSMLTQDADPLVPWLRTWPGAAEHFWLLYVTSDSSERVVRGTKLVRSGGVVTDGIDVALLTLVTAPNQTFDGFSLCSLPSGRTVVVASVFTQGST